MFSASNILEGWTFFINSLVISRVLFKTDVGYVLFQLGYRVAYASLFFTVMFTFKSWFKEVSFSGIISGRVLVVMFLRGDLD